MRAFVFFFNDTATTEIYTLSLHDALPILFLSQADRGQGARLAPWASLAALAHEVIDFHEDRKSTRLNSSHSQISYAVFCLKKKKPATTRINTTSHPQGRRQRVRRPGARPV